MKVGKLIQKLKKLDSHKEILLELSVLKRGGGSPWTGYLGDVRVEIRRKISDVVESSSGKLLIHAVPDKNLLNLDWESFAKD